MYAKIKELYIYYHKKMKNNRRDTKTKFLLPLKLVGKQLTHQYGNYKRIIIFNNILT